MREKQAPAQGQRGRPSPSPRRPPGIAPTTAQQRAEGLAGKTTFLAHNPLFCDLDASELGELDRITNVIACQPGQMLYRPGEKSSMLFLLKSGRVQLYHLSADGRKLIIAMLEPDACFGGIPLTGDDQHQSFAEAVEDSLVYMMHRADVEQLLAQKPGAMRALLQIVGQRCTQLETRLVDTTFKSTTARLATLLLQLARSNQALQPGESAELVVVGFSQGELADRLGVYRETVALALRELKEGSIIELGRKYITICRPALLQELAGGQ